MHRRPKVAEWLKENVHDVFSICDKARGLDDEKVLKIANDENYILITNDKDFSELVFRLKKPHKGIVLLRLENKLGNPEIGYPNRSIFEECDSSNV